jgi:hypothetical protein
MRIRWVCLVVVVGLAAAGCASDAGAETESGDDIDIASLEGGGAATTVVEEVADQEIDLEEAMLDFIACLRDQGFDIPDPQMDENGNFYFRMGAGLDRSQMEGFMEARDACREHLEGVAQRFERMDRTEMEDTLLEFAACMRDNGYDMPDPDLSFGRRSYGDSGGGPGSGPGGGPFGGGLDPEDPAFQTALEACRDIFGGMPGGQTYE